MKQNLLSANRWTQALSLRVSTGFRQANRTLRQKLDINDAHGRNLLVVRVRWMVLGLFSLYAVLSGSIVAFTQEGFFLSPLQLAALFATVAAIALYNGIYHVAGDRFHRWPFANFLQVLLDFGAITLLIHFSGGDASYFWPAYLIGTLEAAILIERRRHVYLLGAIASLFYGALLGLEYAGVLSAIEMPFVNHQTHASGVYQLLLWLWVVILNATAAAIGTYLMKAIRLEHAALRASEERLIDFLDTANDLIFSCAPDSSLCYANRSWKNVMGMAGQEVAGKSVKELLAEGSQSQWTEALEQALAGEPVERLEFQLMSAAGEQVDVEGHITLGEGEDGEARFWALFRDVTARKKAEEQLYHLAHHDALTGLPNRMLFYDRLQQALALGRRLRHNVAVFFLDLDRFKLINDTLGHAAGDQLLQKVARRLTATVREVDTVARLGGDEFTVLAVNLKGEEDARAIAGKILDALKRSVTLDENELFVTSSIGIAMADGQDELSATTLIKRADLAMYHAKSNGRNDYQFYRPDMDQEAQLRFTLERDLRRAIEERQFVLHYQPKVNLESGAITAVEALIRWQHPEIGLLLPGDFISLAEECGVIHELGRWAMSEACRQNRCWQDAGVPPVRMAVNLSGYQLQDKGFPGMIREVLAETGLAPQWLELEITETILMQNPDFAVDVLGDLARSGIHLSVDDFGTGYSSLAQIKRFAVDTLKIDKSFVRDLERNQADAAITSAIISMGSSLNMKVIAEGVETTGQLEFLRSLRCNEMQGFLVSRPLPAEQIVHLLRQEAPHPWPPHEA